MKLISCESCGVVLDTDRIDEPNIYGTSEYDYNIIDENAIWVNRDYVPGIHCPCCRAKISYYTGEM